MQLKYEDKYKEKIKEYVMKYAQRDMVIAEMTKGKLSQGGKDPFSQNGSSKNGAKNGKKEAVDSQQTNGKKQAADNLSETSLGAGGDDDDDDDMNEEDLEDVEDVEDDDNEAS